MCSNGPLTYMGGIAGIVRETMIQGFSTANESVKILPIANCDETIDLVYLGLWMKLVKALYHC